MSAQQTPPEATMAQQLLDFTRRMMEGVIHDHSVRADHDGHCCSLATEYAARLGMETTPSPAPEVPATFRDKELFAESGTSTVKPQRKPTETAWASDRQLDYIMSLGRRVSINLISPKHRKMLQDVRNGEPLKRDEASELIEAMKAQTDQRPHPASDSQIRYLHSLVKTREWNGTIDFENLSSAVASGLIADLKVAPRKTSADADEVVYTTSTRAEPEEGFYFVEGTYYKVLRSANGAQRLHAKIWHHEAERWLYNGQKPFRLLTPETRLTAEQASEFGKLYGRCIARGCELSNDVSLHWGYGEKCAKNNGWPYHDNY